MWHIICLVLWDRCVKKLAWSCWQTCKRLKSVGELIIFSPAGIKPMSHRSGALTALYLNVRQRKTKVSHYFHSDSWLCGHRTVCSSVTHMLRFAPMWGIYFLKNYVWQYFFFWDIKNKVSYLQDKRRPVYISLRLSQIYFFPIFQSSEMVHFLIFCFASFWITITSGPSGRVGRLVVRPCCRPWLGPFGSALAGLPVAAGRLVLRIAVLACVCCRVES
jgi:hypothetical protein